uniref:Uncharacterized protein n=1 Tax=Eptatretus burgeri TaxID=7764 RepID=A0A8C4WVK8_EPTBU
MYGEEAGGIMTSVIMGVVIGSLVILGVLITLCVLCCYCCECCCFSDRDIHYRTVQQMHVSNQVQAAYPRVPAAYPGVPAAYPGVPAAYPGVPAAYPRVPAMHPGGPAPYPTAPTFQPTAPGTLMGPYPENVSSMPPPPYEVATGMIARR